jgi:uncharacterized protein YbjT (DUF2867 family)
MILVTAATGQVGAPLVRMLSERGTPCRALVRRDVPELDLPNVEQVRGDFHDGASLDRAMAGVGRVYLACAPTPTQPVLEGLAIAAAERNGVRHVVKLSAYDAHDANPSDFRRWNGIAERRLMESGLAWTILRPTAFHQSVDAVAIARRGELLSPQGEAASPFIDARDIAAAAAAVLTGEGHAGRIYDLTGPEAFTQDEVAAMVAEVIGRPVVCRPVSDGEALRGLLEGGMEPGFARSMIAHWQAYRAKPVTLISGWVEILAGRPPRCLRPYVEECARCGGFV